jgi:hypothetical protein
MSVRKAIIHAAQHAIVAPMSTSPFRMRPRSREPSPGRKRLAITYGAAFLRIAHGETTGTHW